MTAPFLSKRISKVAPSLTLAITAKAKALKAQGVNVVSLGAGEPDFDTPQAIKQSAIDSLNQGFTKYTPSSGTQELREAICRKFKKDNALLYSPQQIVVSSGAKHSLYNTIQVLCDRGDEVIIPSPYWLSYPEMVKLAQAKPIFIEARPENNFVMTEKDLVKKITKKTKALILNSPSNPTGSIYGREELIKVARLAVKHNFFIISDEIYEKFIYGNRPHISIASLAKDVYERTITVNGVSKSYAMTGWRIGYAAGPNEIMRSVANLQSHATSNASSIGQKAAYAALEGDQKCVEDMRKEFEKRRELLINRMNEIKNISFIKPEGAFYLFCDISRFKMDSSILANRILDEAKVAVIPGTPFGAKFYIRLSFAASVDFINKG